MTGPVMTLILGLPTRLAGPFFASPRRDGGRWTKSETRRPQSDPRRRCDSAARRSPNDAAPNDTYHEFEVSVFGISFGVLHFHLEFRRDDLSSKFTVQ